MNLRAKRPYVWGLLSLLAVQAALLAQERELVILYTNDFHSAIDPIPAYWMEGDPPPLLGGAAHLMTLVERIRKEEARKGNPVFLFDTGDMFTGMLAKLTQGEVMMEMMATLGYDAMAIGNHEFDYGWRNFRRLMNRVSFPVLGANIFYEGTDIPFAPPHTILEKEGLRLGVIGIIGQDARSVILPSMVTELRFEDPAPHVADSLWELQDDVDLIVVLAHQGRTGPMQTDAEAHADLQRDFEADIKLSGRVPGIDVFVGGHAHRGIEEPFVHPQNKTLIVQTYGYGTRLGYLRLKIDTESGEVLSHQGELLKVWSRKLPPDARMLRKMQPYKERTAPIIGPVVGRSRQRLIRRYNQESPLGSFAADVLRQAGKAEVGFTNAGGLRADLPEGEITIGNVQDAFPFYNDLVVLEMTGRQIAQVLEQGLTLLRGMIQVSGLQARYDLSKPFGERLLQLSIAGKPADPERTYRVAANSFLAEGGDLYKTFTECRWIEHINKDVAALVIEYLKDHREPIELPPSGRLIPVESASAGTARQ